MKKLLLLLGLLAVATGKVQAQSWHPKPKNKDNLLLIQTADSATLALSKLAQAFVAQGFAVERLDEAALTLTLAPKAVAHSYHPVLYVRASANRSASSNVQLRADYRASAGSLRVGSPVEYVGSEGDITKTCFRLVEKVALAYPGGFVSYGKQ